MKLNKNKKEANNDGKTKLIKFQKNLPNIKIFTQIKNSILLYTSKILIYFNILFYYYIIIFYIINLSKEEEIFNSTSKIILTINGKGNQRILSFDKKNNYTFNCIPDIILVNNISQKNKDKYVYNLTE